VKTTLYVRNGSKTGISIVAWQQPALASAGATARAKPIKLIFVFKVGSAPHTNNFGLGETGRHRTNVWDYHGVNALSAKGGVALKMNLTVKPVELIADALKDCSKRGETVLDPFAGSGSTLIAAEKCGRVARLIEFEPRYCDTIIATVRARVASKSTSG